jgi:excisionase family DNA binding protein
LSEGHAVTQLMAVQQIAEYLQMNNDKIYDMAQKAEIPALKIRQQWRFNKVDIESWLRSCSVNSALKKNQRKGKCS